MEGDRERVVTSTGVCALGTNVRDLLIREIGQKHY